MHRKGTGGSEPAASHVHASMDRGVYAVVSLSSSVRNRPSMGVP